MSKDLATKNWASGFRFLGSGACRVWELGSFWELGAALGSATREYTVILNPSFNTLNPKPWYDRFRFKGFRNYSRASRPCWCGEALNPKPLFMVKLLKQQLDKVEFLP